MEGHIFISLIVIILGYLLIAKFFTKKDANTTGGGNKFKDELKSYYKDSYDKFYNIDKTKKTHKSSFDKKLDEVKKATNNVSLFEFIYSLFLIFLFVIKKILTGIFIFLFVLFVAFIGITIIVFLFQMLFKFIGYVWGSN